MPTFQPDGADLSPHSVEAEQQVLGALLCDNELIDKVSDLLSPEIFYEPVHGTIYKHLTGLIAAGRVASPVTLGVLLEQDEDLRELGGRRYLARMAGGAVATFAIRDYCSMLVDLCDKRRILSLTNHARAAISDGSEAASKIAIELEGAMGVLASKSKAKPLTVSHTVAITSTLEAINKAYQGEVDPGVSTGIADLDKILGFLRPGNMVVVGARPAMGKTTLAQNIAYTAAKQKIGVFFGSLEMLAPELGMRFISRGLKDRGVSIPYNRLIQGDLSEAEIRQVVEEAQDQIALPIEIAEREAREVSRFRAAVRRAKHNLENKGAPLGLVIVDYVQKMVVDGARSFYESASQASDMIKSVAMDFEVPVLALAQLSREVERRDPAIPQLADLRETGKLEEDADVAMFCYRPAYYLQRKIDQADQSDIGHIADLEAAMARIRNDLQMIIAKQRSGKTGSVTAQVDLGCCHVWKPETQYQSQHAMEGF